MFKQVFPHKVAFKEEKDSPFFEELKEYYRKSGNECINIYAFYENKNSEKELKVIVLLKSAIGIIPSDEKMINRWNNLVEKYGVEGYTVEHINFVYISMEAIALEKNIRDDKNKIYVSKLIQKNLKITPYKVFAFNTSINNEENNERTGLYYYSSGYNVIFDTKEDYEKALGKKEEVIKTITLWINKMCYETAKRKVGLEPIIRFLYRDLISDIEILDKENAKQF